MSDPGNRRPTEYFVWHERESASTTSRFYFRETLNRRLFVGSIKPMLISLFQEDPEDVVPGYTQSDITVHGYPHYISLRWVRDVSASDRIHEQYAKHIEDHVDIVLNHAFGWRSSVKRSFGSYGQVIEASRRFGQNWLKGQMEV